MMSEITVSRNVTSNHLNNQQSSRIMGKISNPNPNLSNHQFSRKQLDLENDELLSATSLGDASSFNHHRRKQERIIDYVNFDISSLSKSEIRSLKARLMSELEKVRSLSNRVYSGNFRNDSLNNHIKKRPLPFQSQTKEAKRVKQQKGETSCVASPQLMKMCSQVLTKVMKQKNGHIFNAPVDAVALKLHDYHQIVKKPMDLGTIMNKLNQRVYKNPDEFAADVRLTFNNALLYNPKGHEVHSLAERFLKQFEESFQPVSKRFQHEKTQSFNRIKNQVEIPEKDVLDVDDEVQGSCLSKNPSPVQKYKPPRDAEVFSTPVTVPALMSAEVAQPAQKVEDVVVVGARVKNAKPPKPKAKELNKREMTMVEKHRLGLGLRSLPDEKMIHVLQIIRKRNGYLTQDGDEIELDIDVFDTETLWELDRFVTNFKKMVSKLKRQALMPVRDHNLSHFDKHNQVDGAETVLETAKEVKRGVGDDEDVDIGDEIPVHNFPPVVIDKDYCKNQGGGDDDRESSSSRSSSSSSSDTSSSSDSDSGSSSDSDSDVDEAQSRDNQSNNIAH
ncbi:transcription factor GTE2-like [Amaranthus tricolor]|uniref:transcription factor GTE2-like n=1 Tax=Amaranthus tricolor TaxID=29722 RepID=UPI002584C1C4|nr:transcription factor GTE2-like [Amaranthus tricolor]